MRFIVAIQRSAFIALALASFADSTWVHAQGIVDSESLAEIVVTAEKRSENAQNVPITMATLSREQLERQQIRGVSDLAALVPNLQVNQPLGDQVPVFSVRGITMSDYSLGQDGPVAVYYDEVYKGNVALLGLGLYDLERVEVLKGPQGTLYGKNTTGGAINFISRAPDFTTGGYLSAGYGNYSHFQAEGAAQTSITDTLAVRIAMTFENAKGWFKNDAPGAPDLEAKNQYGFRGTLRFKPNDRLDLIVRASTSLQNPWAYGISPVPGPNGVGAPIYPSPGANGAILQPQFRTGMDAREGNIPAPGHRYAQTYALSVTANINLNDQFRILSISSLDKGTLIQPEDSDGTQLGLINGDYYGRTRQASQDLRLTSEFTGPFNFILGAYYNREKLFNSTTYSYGTDIDINGDGVLNAEDCIDGGFLLGCQYQAKFNQEKKSFALYSDASYKFSDMVKLRGGLRYTHDKGDLTDFTSDVRDIYGNPIANVIPGIEGQTATLTFRNDNVSGKVGIDINAGSDLLLYASYSRGFRGSAFNQQAIFVPSELSVVKPEDVSSFEAGFKSEFFTHRLRINGAVFTYKYKNEQVLDTDPITATPTLENLPRSTINGFELDVSALPAAGLTLSASLGLLDSKIKEGTFQGASVAGNRLPNAPVATASAGIDWKRSVGGMGILELHWDGAYTGKQYFDTLNLATTTEDSYFIMNARLRLSDAQNRYGVALWCKNLGDTTFHTNLIDLSGFGYTYTHLNSPRMYGISVDAKF